MNIMAYLTYLRPAFKANPITLILLGLLCISRVVYADPIRIAVSLTPLSLPFYVADEMGYFEDYQVPVQLIPIMGGHRAFNMLQEGRADLATSSETVVMFNSFKYDNYAILATFVNCLDDIKLITHPDSGINALIQLKEKKIGIVKGSASHYFLSTLLELNGLNSDNVTLIDLKPEEMLKQLAAHTVDAVAIWEPFAYQILKVLPNAQIKSPTGQYRLTFNLIRSERSKAQHQEAISRVLYALSDAEGFIYEHPEKAQHILKERLHLDQGFIDWIWPSLDYGLMLDQSLLFTLESEARWAKREGFVDNMKYINYLNYIDQAPLKHLKPSSISILE